MTRRSDVGYCPECDAKVSVNSPKIGQVIVCRVCETRLEVIDINPLELDWAFDDDLDDEFDDLEFVVDAEDEHLYEDD